MRLVLIDADLIVYEAAFCVERKEKDGEYLNWYQVSQIVNTIVRRILKGSKATHQMGFLTEGKSNFRLARAFSLPYKGQRQTNQEKPQFYDEIRDYLQKHFGFQMMRGVEADDALTIVSEYFADRNDVETLIATKDKDLWQYPGEHYNMNTNELMHISDAEAHKNLWRQMILGDMGTDNIPGLSHAAKWNTHFNDDESKKKFRPIPCHQYGKARAEKLLDNWNPRDYDTNIFELYVTEYDDEGGDDYGEQRFYETFDLIYMLRKAPKGLKIHYNPVKIKKADLAFESDLVGYRPALEF